MANTTGFKTDEQGLYIEKSPTAVLDYNLNWTDWLGSDTIASVSTSVSTIAADASPLAIDSSSNTTTQTTEVLSGGTVGNIYTVTTTVTMADSTVEARQYRVIIKNRSA